MMMQSMKRRWKTILVAGAIAAAGVLAGVGAGDTFGSGAATTPAATAGGTQTKTVFMDIHLLNRRKGGAKKLNKLHAAMAAEGWHYANMQAWTENGDLEGFFVTYTR